MADRERMGSGIYFDGADLDEFAKWRRTKILGGATTNPVILKESNVLDVPGHIQKMVEIAGQGFPISIEIPDTRMTAQEMVELGLRYKERFPHNAVIKIPMDPREPAKSFEAMALLHESGVRVNATLGLTGGQLIAAAEAIGRPRGEGDNYISLFWGRRDQAKAQIIKEQAEKLPEEEREEASRRLEQQILGAPETLEMVLQYLDTHGLDGVRVIVGSVRTPLQVDQAFAKGAHIVTIRPELLALWMYTKRGVETADEFNNAYDEVRDKVKLI